MNLLICVKVVIATTKVRIFKQITTLLSLLHLQMRCYCYHKGTYFQANHNKVRMFRANVNVVIATTKVRIFKQITTIGGEKYTVTELLLLPQRYVFSSKSQLRIIITNAHRSCYCYHKGTYFQANHNHEHKYEVSTTVVIATTKVRIFKQITTKL